MKYSQILLGIVICIILEFFIYNINHKYHFFTPIFTTTSSQSYEKHEGLGKFTNPLLECVSPEEPSPFGRIRISKTELTDLVDNIEKSGKVKTLSIYIRDLNNGPWVSVNSNEKFIGASLLKVPLLISYMKLAEADPSLLLKKIKYDKKINDDLQYYNPEKEIEVGKTYTVEELLEYAVYYSDNNAADLLAQNIPNNEFVKTFEALGLGEPELNNPFNVDTRTYASFFRILFNASYLNKDYSERALEMLSHAEFNKGITQKIPRNIAVSHKFGIRSENEVNQLHDCGIVYYPKNPYLICIMSKGGEFPDLADSISKISKFVYDQVDKNL